MRLFIFQWINFLILIGVLIWALRKGLTSFFKKQRAELEADMQSASAEFENMKKEYDEAHRLLNNLPKKIDDLKSAAIRELQFEAKRIETDSETLVTKMLADGEARMKNETERARLEIQKELFEKALAIAKASLSTELQTKNELWIRQMVESDSANDQPSKKKKYGS